MKELHAAVTSRGTEQEEGAAHCSDQQRNGKENKRKQLHTAVTSRGREQVEGTAHCCD